MHLKDTGSVISLSWTADSTQLAAAGGSGAVVFGHVVDVALEDGKMQVCMCMCVCVFRVQRVPDLLHDCGPTWVWDAQA
jgi:hypothetical protein